MVSFKTLLLTITAFVRATNASTHEAHGAILRHLGVVTNYLEEHGRSMTAADFDRMLEGFAPLINHEDLGEVDDTLAQQYEVALGKLAEAAEGIDFEAL